MKAVIYVRVSSKEQEQEGYSIPAQKKLLFEYALKHNLTVVEVFEEAETAKRAGREQFTVMLEYLKSHSDVKVLLVEKTDRLYRNFKDYSLLDPEGLNIELHLVKENMIISKDSRSQEKFVHGIRVLMAKNYCDNLSEEVKKGMYEKLSSGFWPSVAPLGYLNKLDDHTIIPDPNTAHLIKRAYELAATGTFSLNRLKKQLYGEGLRSSRAKKELGKQAIARVLSHPIYYGLIQWGGKSVVGKHEPIISQQLFEKVQEVMGWKQKPRVTKNDFPFMGLLTCSHCGCAITAEQKRKKSGKTYIYYHCTNGKGACENVTYVRQENIENAIIEALNGIKLSEQIIEWTREALLESLSDERTYHEDSLKTLQARYVKLQGLIDKCYEDKLEGRIELDLWERKTGEWKKEQDEIAIKVNAHKQANTSYMLDGVQLMNLANKAGGLFEQMTTQEKRETVQNVLSNLRVENGSVRYDYKMPFSMFVNVTDLEKWRGGRDSNPRPPP